MNHVRFQSCYTRPVRHIVVVVVVVSGIQPTPIAWEVIISSGAGNHCEKSRDDSVYKPMTTDGDFLLRFLSKQNKNLDLLLIFKLKKKKIWRLHYHMDIVLQHSSRQVSHRFTPCLFVYKKCEIAVVAIVSKLSRVLQISCWREWLHAHGISKVF